MFQHPMQFILISIVAISALVGCGAIQKRDCQYTNWYELGRQDGSQGQQANGYDERTRSCRNAVEEAESQYRAGYSAGLVQFCSNEFAFDLGRSGKGLPRLCEKATGTTFKRSYRLGRQVLDLEKEVLKIDRQIRELSAGQKQERKPSTLSNDPKVEQTLNQLKNKRTLSLQKIKKLKAIF